MATDFSAIMGSDGTPVEGKQLFGKASLDALLKSIKATRDVLTAADAKIVADQKTVDAGQDVNISANTKKNEEQDTTIAGIRADLGEKNAAAGADTAFARIKQLEESLTSVTGDLTKLVTYLSNQLDADAVNTAYKTAVGDAVTSGTDKP